MLCTHEEFWDVESLAEVVLDSKMASSGLVILVVLEGRMEGTAMCLLEQVSNWESVL
jgi:hypothetical protein